MAQAGNDPDSAFDLYQFEDRIEELLSTLIRLRSENQALRAERDDQQRRNADLKQRLEVIVERLRRLEQPALTPAANVAVQ